jgi:hypothetical protein
MMAIFSTIIVRQISVPMIKPGQISPVILKELQAREFWRT